MVSHLKYVSHSQYSSGNSKYDFNNRFPADMRPIATCPDNTAVYICSADGFQAYGIRHRDSFKKVEMKEGYGPMMSGEIHHPVGWRPLERK